MRKNIKGFHVIELLFVMMVITISVTFSYWHSDKQANLYYYGVMEQAEALVAEVSPFIINPYLSSESSLSQKNDDQSSMPRPDINEAALRKSTDIAYNGCYAIEKTSEEIRVADKVETLRKIKSHCAGLFLALKDRDLPKAATEMASMQKLIPFTEPKSVRDAQRKARPIWPLMLWVN